MSKIKTAFKVSHNRFGIVEKFAYKADNHPWIKLDAKDKNVAHVTIPNDYVQSISELNVILPYEDGDQEKTKGGFNGCLERWLQQRFFAILETIKDEHGNETQIRVKEGDKALSFTCSIHYLAGKLFAKAR